MLNNAFNVNGTYLLNRMKPKVIILSQCVLVFETNAW